MDPQNFLASVSTACKQLAAPAPWSFLSNKDEKEEEQEIKDDNEEDMQ